MKALTVVTSGNTNAIATTKPTGLAKLIAELEDIESIAKHEVRLTVEMSYTDIHNGPEARERLKEAVRTAKAYVESDEYRESADALNAAMAYATEEEIGRELKLLLGAWPNTSKNDLATFGALLTVEVRAKALSRFALMAACRKLRTTAKFLPVIAEVLEAVSDAESRLTRFAGHHHELPQRTSDSQRALEHCAERLAHYESERKWKDEVLARAPGHCERCRRGTDRLYAFSQRGDGSDGECLCWTCYMPSQANRA